MPGARTFSVEEPLEVQRTSGVCMWRRTIRLLFALIGSAGFLSFSASAFGAPAPFGFSWGPVDKVPTPSLATRHDNVTLLIYRRDRLPSDELPGTEEIVLQVCK